MKTVFIDMDGSICVYATHDDKVNMTEFPDGCFRHRQPVEPVINAIIDNFCDTREYNLAILSAAPHNQAIIEKNDWLDEHFNIPERHFIQWKTQSKADYIQQYAEHYGIDLTDIILIDDEHKILSEVEKLGCQVYHISRLLTLGRERVR